MTTDAGLTMEPFFAVGRRAGASGQVSIDGTGSAINLTPTATTGNPGAVAAVHIGREGGIGTVQITNGGALNVILDPVPSPVPDRQSDVISVGLQGGTGTLSVDNGSVSVQGTGAALQVGREGGTGAVSLTNGSTLVVRSLTDHPNGASIVVGRDLGGVGTMSVLNSQVTIDGSLATGIGSGLHVGRESGAQGTVSINGASARLDILSGQTAFITIGRDATASGQLNIGGGAVVNMQGDRAVIDLGRFPGAHGELRITGGSVVDLSGSPSDANLLVGAAFATKTSAGSGRLIIDGAGSTLRLTDTPDPGAANLRRAIIGAAPTIGGISSDGGHVTVRNGGLLVADIVHVGIGGLLDGNGTIQGNVSLEGGTIAPGTSPGEMTILGDLLLDSGLLFIEVFGLGAGEFDRIVVTGDVTLGGATIVFQFMDGFLPQLGDVIDFLEVGGTIFDLGNTTYIVEGVAPGFAFSVSGLGDGTFALLAESNAQAVPEPTALALFGLALAGLGMAARRRR